MDWMTLVAVATALGAGATAKYLLDRVLGRHERRIGLDVSLVGAAGDLLTISQAQVTLAHNQVQALTVEVKALSARLDLMDDENDALRAKVTFLETENARLLGAVAASAATAEEVKSLSNRNDRLRRRVKVLEDVLRQEGIPVHEDTNNGGTE
jgi:septal ring factor EnvC (AmiA/AmiB activator)